MVRVVPRSVTMALLAKIPAMHESVPWSVCLSWKSINVIQYYCFHINSLNIGTKGGAANSGNCERINLITADAAGCKRPSQIGKTRFEVIPEKPRLTQYTRKA